MTRVQPRARRAQSSSSRPRAGIAGVALLDAPVRVREQLRGPDAGDPERRERQRHRRRRDRQREAALEVRQADPERGPLQDRHAGDREQRHRPRPARSSPARAAVAAREQQQRPPPGWSGWPRSTPGGSARNVPQRGIDPAEARRRPPPRRPGTPCAPPGRRSPPSRRSAPAWPAVMNSQSQQSHDAPSRGPGRVSNAASVVLPCVIAYRPSSTWTKTLITQLSRISQSRRTPPWPPGSSC